MPWKKHKKRTYYYKNRRLNGRVISEYLGRGPEAEQRAEEDRAERERIKIREQTYRNLDALVAEYDHRINVLVTATLLANGYYCHKRQWRKRMDIPQLPADVHPDEETLNLSLEELIAITRVDKPELPHVIALRERLRDDMDYVRHLGDIADNSRQEVTYNLFGDIIQQESVAIMAQDLQDQLTLPTDGPLERVLVQQCVNAYLQHYAIEFRYSSEKSISDDNNVMDNRITHSQKRLLRVVQTLAHIRRLALPAMQINIAQSQTNIATGPALNTPTTKTIDP